MAMIVFIRRLVLCMVCKSVGVSYLIAGQYMQHNGKLGHQIDRTIRAIGVK